MPDRQGQLGGSLDDPRRVEVVGPFDVHELVVNGYTVPGVQCKEEDGGRVLFMVDRRMGYSISAADFEEVACLVADMYALGIGLTCAPDARYEGEAWSEALARVPALLRPRRTVEITSVQAEEIVPDA